MAIFSKTKKEETKEAKVAGSSVKFAGILMHPHITEKASVEAEHNVFTFEVSPRANKIQIKKAVEELYNVKPVRVNIVVSPSKSVIVRGKRGVKSGGKKAYVYLKKGDTLEFV